MPESMFVIVLLSDIIFATIGIRIAGGEAWKGAVLAVAFVAGGIASIALAPNSLLAFIAGVVAASIVAGAMKVPRRQAANALLGCIIGQFIPVFFI